jgi:hypothetical protein
VFYQPNAVGSGSHLITAAFSSDATLSGSSGDQTVTVTPLTINVAANAQTRTYGDADPTLTYTYDPPLVNSDSFSGALTRDEGDHVGEYSITQGTLALSADYTLLYTGAKLTVTPLSITVTADPKSKAVGGADPGLTYTVAPSLVNGDNFSGALVRTAGETAGAYPILIGTLTAGADYDLTFVGADFVIAVPPVVTLHPASVTIKRGGTATFTAEASGDPVPTVIWQVSTDGGEHFTDLSGETSRTLTITAPPLGSHGNRYRAVFTNGGGSATTDPATLTFLYYILSIPLVLR